MGPQQEPGKHQRSSAARKRVVRYAECRKNHAARIGGHAVDGCREFMPAGGEGTAGALQCAACSCHRSFHRREVEDDVLRDRSSDSATL